MSTVPQETENVNLEEVLAPEILEEIYNFGHSVIHNSGTPRQEHDDLFQDYCIGVFDAAARLDIANAIKTYLKTCGRGHVFMAIRDRGGADYLFYDVERYETNDKGEKVAVFTEGEPRKFASLERIQDAGRFDAAEDAFSRSFRDKAMQEAPDIFEASNGLRSVRLAVDLLPEELREVVEMRFFDGMTQEEVADSTGQVQRTVSNKEHRALEMLYTLLHTNAVQSKAEDENGEPDMAKNNVIVPGDVADYTPHRITDDMTPLERQEAEESNRRVAEIQSLKTVKETA